ncbi:MAG: serine/threonine protein kinase, bacterial [Gaiellaceae bacterium]|nr:serine/threonine protein kinase, bacterial [Mycobacterium sp.]MDX6410461.1 serine/threonine protein kinase, bacterial [Gaiellaceae bacterium]
MLRESRVDAKGARPTAAHDVTSSETRWRECACDDVSYRVPGTNGEVGWKFNLGGVELRNDELSS